MKQHLLLVEDDLPLASMVRDFLVEHGFYVDVESDGQAAIDRIASHSVDAVILDIGLPDTDGFEVCRSVRPTYAGPSLF